MKQSCIIVLFWYFQEKAKQDGKTNENGVTENDAFEGIGDDDLWVVWTAA